MVQVIEMLSLKLSESISDLQRLFCRIPLACECHAGRDNFFLKNVELSVPSTELGTQEVLKECEREWMKVPRG